jgi:hypothetical protein
MYITFELEVQECASCKKPMMGKGGLGLFPRYHSKNQETQMRERGIVYSSTDTINEAPICTICSAEGKASFTCCMCGNNYSSNNIQQRFGDPPEYLCKTCYSTVTAEAWEAMVDKLEKYHRWDFD